MKHYNGISNGYDVLYGEEQEKKLNIIRNKLIIKKTDKLLDVGCGTGISTQWNCDCTGIDPSIDMLKKGKNAKYIHANAEKLPFENNSFDIVISLTAIHNFSDYKKGLSEIKRVGKDKFVLTILKRSFKAQDILNEIKSMFDVIEIIEEEKDIICFIK